MSISFYWKIATSDRAPHFTCGTSSDAEIIVEIFNNRVSSRDLKTLRSMHLVTGNVVSLWSEIYDVIESMQGGDPTREIVLNIWPED